MRLVVLSLHNTGGRSQGGFWRHTDGGGQISIRNGAPRTSLFVGAGGGGDVIAASILRRKLGHPDDPFVVTYSWDRLLIDPLPGPRDPSWFDDLTPFGVHNHIVTGRTRPRPPANSLLPRLAKELSTGFYLLDPRAGVCSIRRQLSELVDLLAVGRVYIVDSGGDILAHGHEPWLRSPLADAMVLAASEDIRVPVEILITAAGLDGELSAGYVRSTVVEVAREEMPDEPVWCRIDVDDVGEIGDLLSWHPSEVNGLLIAAARGFRGVVEIRDAALHVTVDDDSSAVYRCSRDALLARNLLAKSMLDSSSLRDAEQQLLHHRDFSELAYQRGRADMYRSRTAVVDVRPRIRTLLEYCEDRPSDVDALTLRRAAEVMEVSIGDLPAVATELSARFGRRYRPPLWLL